MISEKMKGFVKNSSIIRAMFEEGKRLADLYGAENVYDFSIGNPVWSLRLRLRIQFYILP
jgi:aspartate aminotransferase